VKITIVGAGIMGLSAAWALNRDGHEVSVFEQGAIPNPRGSSVDEHRLIRHPYGAERGYTRMIRSAYTAWDLLWTDLGTRHYAATGTLVLDRGDRWTAATAENLTRENVPFRRLDTGDFLRSFSLLTAKDLVGALLLETGGTLFAGDIVTDLARYLRTCGVPVAEQAPVRDIDPERGRITLSAGESVDADLVIIAAGPWAPRLVPALKPRVTPSRQVVVYLDPPAALAARWRHHPMILDIDTNAGFYLVPPRPRANGEVSGLKIGDHSFTLSGDPDRDRQATAEETHQLIAQVGSRLRDIGRYALREAKTCFYDVTADEHFVVEPAGARGWVLSGFSGHGFKFGTVIGLELARTLRGEQDGAALAAWAAGVLKDPP
jgi:glycine/D-amino acid oxidase-like deaminating enzyme